MTRRKKRRSYRVSATPEVLMRLGAAMVATHVDHISDGYAINPAQSGVWRKQDGSLTIRLAYANQPSSCCRLQIVHTVRSAPLAFKVQV
jgi:hypothetical protein